MARIKTVCDWLQLFFLFSLILQAVKSCTATLDIDSTILQPALYTKVLSPHRQCKLKVAVTV